MSRRILLVEDDAAFRAEVRELLTSLGYGVLERSSAEEALREFEIEAQEVVLTDIRMGSLSGTSLCDLLREKDPHLPVIVMTGFGTIALAVETLRAGAFDFLSKPFASEQLRASIERAVHHRDLTIELHRTREAARESTVAAAIVGESAPIRELRELIARIAPTDVSVLVDGESGTGKELVARSLHQLSARRAGPFIAINCAAIPEALLESELFGHAKGAFTDAKAARPGLLCRASGGTLFLDEIGEMSGAMQAKLLRALESRTVRPVGSYDEIEFDARLICATHRDLDEAAREGRFREDLLYRIQVLRLHVPALRLRGHDVLRLAQLFLARKRESGVGDFRLGPEAGERLLRYPWPGNVRELQNAIDHATALATTSVLAVSDLPPKIRDFQRHTVTLENSAEAELLTLEEVEKRHIVRVLAAVDQSRAEATKILGIDRSTLYRKLEKLGLRLGSKDGS
ncbi:MAG: sigma-54 dependent transcriptional regulator [Polyangiaceae bacterium]